MIYVADITFDNIELKR